MSKARLIIIDDEHAMTEFASDVAIKNGYEVKKFTNPLKFIRWYKNCADVLMIDLVMPEMDGIEIIRYLSSINSKAQIILISGFDSGVLQSAHLLASEHSLNVVGTLQKPFRFKELNSLFQSLNIPEKREACHLCDDSFTITELNNALLNNELIVYYQPKINTHNVLQSTVEALVRWQHPRLGLILPDRFLPLAEESGLVDELTWIVLRQVVRQCKQWMLEGVNIQVSVNMSANTLKDLSLPDKLEKLLSKHGLFTSQLVLEITETALMDELITSLDILTRLRVKGIELSIDDFGTGYSSMVQLHRVPFSEIKIDRSFVSVMEHDDEAKAIVETIIMLGHKLNMKTVAEGVETADCQAQLIELGCDELQGYAFSKPVPGDQILDWLKDFQNKNGN